VIYFNGFLLVVLATGKGIYCDGEANGESWGRIADIKRLWLIVLTKRSSQSLNSVIFSRVAAK